MADYAYGYIVPDSSLQYLSYSDISEMSVQVLCYARYEIYARNGRMFQSAELQNYFNRQYWYTPIFRPDEFSDTQLNVYETANVALLEAREQQLGGYLLDQGFYSYDEVYAYINAMGESLDDFEVDPESYIFYDSDRRYLTNMEISQLTMQELCFARNEVYARRGRLFESEELSSYFDQKYWYWGFIAPTQFSEGTLNAYEVANVQALLQEEYRRDPAGYILDQPGYSYAGIGSYTSYMTYTASSQSDYIFWDSNTRYLTESEVAGLSLRTLCYARNEIYARRGYIFQSQELRDYFGSKDWYYPAVPGSSFSASVLNSYEVANIELIKTYEFAIDPNGYQLY